MKNQQKSIETGFTLVELLVIIAIIGLMAAIIVVGLNQSREKGKDARRVTDVKQLSNALELYGADHEGTYPIAETPTTSIPEISPRYIGNIPVAPQPPAAGCNSEDNDYLYTSDGSTFSLKFCLGNKTGDFAPGVYLSTPNGINLQNP